VVTQEERTESLHHMIRAYLNFFHDRGLETWIAHGTLLGWWWNGRILPWDWDIDTQVSGETLGYLAKNLNQTRHRYVAADTKRPREYLLDVNPMSYERVRGDGMNIIDARWIDVKTGLFIDITGLSETEPYVHPGVVSCKNLHHYRMNDLYPMRDTTFEGVPTKIPYAYDKLLVEEYDQKALVLTDYEG
jgi:phosphorylcholine metabolism protein LicD